MRDRRLQGVEAIIQQQQRAPPEGDDLVPSASASTIEYDSFGSVFTSSAAWRLLRHLATVFGLRPTSRLSAANEACDRCIAVPMANMVVIALMANLSRSASFRSRKRIKPWDQTTGGGI